MLVLQSKLKYNNYNIIYSLAPSGRFDVARTIFKPYIAVRYIPARSCPCRCIRLEPGYNITPPLRDMAGIYALYHLRGCYN